MVENRIIRALFSKVFCALLAILLVTVYVVPAYASPVVDEKLAEVDEAYRELQTIEETAFVTVGMYYAAIDAYDAARQARIDA